MTKALRQLVLHLPEGGNPDEHLPVIAATLRSMAADIELVKVENLGSLAQAIFDRIAAANGGTRRIFSAEALIAYSNAIGREVRAEEVQRVVNEMLGANVIMRLGHGVYAITDPFVQEIWRENNTGLM